MRKKNEMKRIERIKGKAGKKIFFFSHNQFLIISLRSKIYISQPVELLTCERFVSL